ncbi:MAG: hypothetical protein LBR67_11115, partial [Dysgonamonadaceae bacterium]|nr:hypothetical protein [Dysgonamonadaceae bacterium]
MYKLAILVCLLIFLRCKETSQNETVDETVNEITIFRDLKFQDGIGISGVTTLEPQNQDTITPFGAGSGKPIWRIAQWGTKFEDLKLGSMNVGWEVPGTAVHSLGNGQMLVYGQQSDIIQLIGPPYSSPSVLSLQLPKEYSVASEREKGTAVWHHQISKNGEPVAEITDFVVAGTPCFIRKIKALQAFYYRATLHKSPIIDNKSVIHDAATTAFLMKTPPGTPFYNDYPLIREQCHQFVTTGAVTLDSSRLQIKPGESFLYVIGGNYPECASATRKIINESPTLWLQQTRDWWQTFTARRRNFESLLPAGAPQRAKLLQTIDDVAVMIKCQQGQEGAVIAGYNYHLGYVRDQYGVSRGLLKLGYTDEARQILDFYYRIWQKEGRIHNAQGLGNFAFHIHENDDVEITGYLIIQAFDYLQTTNDNAFIAHIYPMLEWAWDVQTHQLLKGMLPFNGDETFVAGGLLPRSALMDGSAEATLLFINGGEALLAWAETNGKMTGDRLTEARQILNATKQAYNINFLREGRLATNNPDRMKGETYPEFRHGVCEQANAVEGCQFFGWTQHTETNRYLCANCFVRSSLPAVAPETFFLPSVTLMPYYTHDAFIDPGILGKQLNELADFYIRNRMLPSKQANNGINKITGYDYGFFLYALTLTGNPLAAQVYDDMLSVLDSTGAWVEYYVDGHPNGTFCRPWESAINLEAA